MSKALDKRFERYEQLLSDLIGPLEEWTTEDLERFLADAGIDTDQAHRTLYAKIEAIAGSHHVENRNVPEHVADFLRQMRPVDQPTSDPEVAQSIARAWLTRLLEQGPALGVPQVARAFRNQQSELTADERELLERLETKLNERRKKAD